MSKRKHYSPEYKRELVEPVRRSQSSCWKIALEVGVDQTHWQFRGRCPRRVRIVQRLESDLRLNLAGAALALELLEEVAALRNRITVWEGFGDPYK